MIESVKRFCDDMYNSNGLLLIDMPTGFGKTHRALDYIFHAAMDPHNSNKKYFFVTSVKNNLPEKELRKRFEEAGKLEQFYEKYIFLNSNVDTVISTLTDKIIKQIPGDIKKEGFCKNFIDDAKFLKDRTGEEDPQIKRYLDRTKNDFRVHTEPEFRNKIQSYLYKEFPKSTDRFLAIKHNPRWRWLGDLYPAVYMKERQIFFLSMDKFLSKTTTFVDPPLTLYESDFIDNAIIFIDEFDATKETILKKIIQNGVQNKIDCVQLFKEIRSALLPNTGSFPKALTEPAPYSNTSKGKDLSGIIDSLREKADDVYSRFSLAFEYKNAETNEIQHNFLFQDYQFYSVFNGNNAYISSFSDEENMINYIQYSSEKPKNEKENIQFMLGSLHGFIKYFQNAVKILAYNYKLRKDQWKKGTQEVEKFKMEDAITSVLSLFRLSPEYISYLKSEIILTSFGRKCNIEGSEFDLSFYEMGFRFYSIEDASDHDMHSRIYVSSFNTTPEKILLQICSRAKVVGISATATIPSLIGNYDLEYLSSKLKGNYYTLTKEDRLRLSREFNESNNGYSQTEIHVNLLGKNDSLDYSKESWLQVFNEPDFADLIFNKIEMFLPDKNENYHKERYLRIAMAYKEFLLHKDIQSFLCILTKHPIPGDLYLNRDILDMIFVYLGEEISPEFDVLSSVYQLEGKNFESKKGKLQERLSKGEKIFVITAYQTAGAGQNLHYLIPDALKDKMVSINGRPSRGEKDFDAIYLDKPTNLLVSLGDNLDVEDFTKYLFHSEYLQESSELSRSDARSCIRAAFRCYYTGHSVYAPSKINPYRTNSVILLCTKIIIQAIGRICRTNQKRKNIYVYADSRIADYIDDTVRENRLFNYEFLTLLDAIQNQKKEEVVYGSPENKASLLSIRVNKYIHEMIEGIWTAIGIQQWQHLRLMTLKGPSLSKEEILQNFVARNYYVGLPQKADHYFYNQEGDYSNIQVGFSPSADLPFVVSAQAARLDRLMTVPLLKSLFERNGWATDIKENDYMLSPALFQNVYKGAIGEVAGKCLFEEVLGIVLEDIADPNLFEKFDFKVPGAPVFVDFKNWSESTIFSDEEQLTKISKKAATCKCKCVLIVNILAKKDWRIRSVKRDGVKIVQIPSLLLDRKTIVYNEKAFEKIRRCVNEYSTS